MSDTYLYDTNFYGSQADESSRSADIVVPIVQALVSAESVLDVGCGVGTWLSSWQALGVSDVVGVDGDYIDRAALRISPDSFTAHDLTKVLDLGRRFDLVTTLEVAEHLPAASAATFVASLVAHSDAVLFSAAIPGQAGTGHINCQWQSYWAALFRLHGYHATDVLRPQIWAEGAVAAYYRQNLVLYVTEGRGKQLGIPTSAQPLDVVHPDVYAARVLVPLRKTVEHRLRSYNVRTRLRALARR